jgi:hypothetical protein
LDPVRRWAYPDGPVQNPALGRAPRRRVPGVAATEGRHAPHIFSLQSATGVPGLLRRGTFRSRKRNGIPRS